jgi:MFS transporter, DHA1 family, multidrug resistance protein
MANRSADGDAGKQTTGRTISWRRNLYALWVAQMLAIIGFSLRDAFLPFYLKELGADSTEQAVLWSGLVQAGGAGVMVIAAPFWGFVADRRGRKPMVLRAMFAAMITVGLMAFATEPWQLVALRMVEGAFTGTVAASTALVASSAPRDRLGFALGLIQTAVFSGASLGPFLGGLFANQFGFRPTFLISALFLGSAGIIVIFFVKERFTPMPRGKERGIAAMRASSAWIFAPTLLAMITVLFVTRFAQMGTRPIMPLYFGELGDLTDAQAASISGLAFGLLGATSALASIYLGRRGDRVGHYRVLLASVVGAGLIYLPMSIVGVPWQLVVLQALFGVAAGGLIPAANAIVANSTPPERRGAIYGVTASAGSLGGFIGPLACAGITATLGFRATFAAVGLLLLLLAGALAYVRRSHSHETEAHLARPAD